MCTISPCCAHCIRLLYYLLPLNCHGLEQWVVHTGTSAGLYHSTNGKIPTVNELYLCLYCNNFTWLHFLFILRGSGGGWVIFPFFYYSGPFSFLLIKFHCTCSISYKTLHIMFFIIVFWLGTERSLGFFLFHARFTSLLTHVSLHTFLFWLFVLFHSCCSHAQVFGKTLVHEFHFSSSHTEWYLLLHEAKWSLLGPKLRLSKTTLY